MVNVYTIHLEHDRVFYLDHLVVSDPHISEEVQKKRGGWIDGEVLLLGNRVSQ